MHRPVVALALAALLVLAGCAAPTPGEHTSTDRSATNATTAPATTAADTETAATTTTPGDAQASGPIEVRNGSLPFDPVRIFDRVTELLDEDATPPATIDLRGHESMQTRARGLPAFAETMGIDAPDEPRTVTAAGITRGADYVALNTRFLGDTARTRSVLVHEYVHVVQYQHGSIETTHENVQPGSTDSQLAFLAIVEGVPVYVEDRYEHRYGEGAPTGMDELRRGYRRATGVRKYALAPYAFGAQYVETRAGSAENVDVLYEHPPSTTEAIIHGYGPDEEPVRTLGTDVSADDWRWSDRDRLGELFVRQVLVTELDRQRAATAAAGWGVDRQLTFEHDEINRSAYVWALRWDSTTDADEFENATRAYLDGRGDRVDGGWTDDDTRFSVVRTSPEVVVLVVGPEPFVTETTVSGSNESVDVTVDA